MVAVVGGGNLLCLDKTDAVREDESTRSPPGAAGQRNGISDVLGRGQEASHRGRQVEVAEDDGPPRVMGMEK